LPPPGSKKRANTYRMSPRTILIGEQQMKQGVRSKTDPMEREIELALRPGVFIGYREGFSFVTQLEELAAQIHKLVATEPERALGLSETFLAGCHAKADELDDSDGSFGQFAHKLICLWIKARQALRRRTRQNRLYAAGVDGRRSLRFLP
jgi:hypothetical protein